MGLGRVCSRHSVSFLTLITCFLFYLPLNFRFGLSFLGARFSDAKLIGMAYAFEQRTKVRDKVQPYIVPKTELSDVVGK